LSELLVGVISDTHGLLRETALEVLKDSDLIIHAGDVGDPEIFNALERIAPTKAVRGNVDRGEFAQRLPETEIVETGGLSLYVIHDYSTLDLNPKAAGISAVIYGHSHRASIEWQNGVLLLNPGSAGPRRFRLPASLALLTISNRILSPEIIRLG
jgi:uncharacterized protein